MSLVTVPGKRLTILKEQKVKHIVIANTHIVTASALDLCEMPNQIAREIGYKTWLKWEEKDYDAYPDVGHPFADYWGVWLNTDCGEWELDFISATCRLSLPGQNPYGQHFKRDCCYKVAG